MNPLGTHMKSPVTDALVILCIWLALSISAVADSPNIVIIMTDDQGYGDLSCYGSQTIRSPNLDRMAEEGVRFTNFYSVSSVCTPSRAGLLTGRYPVRSGLEKVLFPNSDYGLPAEELTLAELLKSQGYATAIVGKWHLGHLDRFLPTEHGFDQFYGVPYSNNMPISGDLKLADEIQLNEGYSRERVVAIQNGANNERWKMPMMRDSEVVEYPSPHSESTRQFTEEAIAFIKANKDRPFFLYLTPTMPHWPIDSSAAFKGRSEHGAYADAIEEIDWSVGQIRQVLEAEGLAENTIVVFTSDNGPASGKADFWKWPLGSTGGLRGHKGTIAEGGHRVPAIFWAPGQIPSGQVCHAPASALDLLPTFAAATGAELPETHVLDGNDLSDLLQGEDNPYPDRAFYYFKPNEDVLGAIRVGDWKYWERGGNSLLYHLADDPAEQRNLLKAHPEIANRLRELLAAFAAEVN